MNVGFEPSQVLLSEDILKRVDALCLLLPHSCRTLCHFPLLTLYVRGSFSQYSYYFAPVLPAIPHPCSVAEIFAGNKGFFPVLSAAQRCLKKSLMVAMDAKRQVACLKRI